MRHSPCLGSFAYGMTGKIYLTPQRGPVYNVAKGLDIEADAWGLIPESPLTVHLSNASGFLPVLREAWHSHPVELLNLTLRKVSRMWTVPWNDFRVTVLGVPAYGQVWWHILLWILAISGSIAILTGVPLRLMPGDKGHITSFIGYASILFILGHLAYLPFEAISRYGFTAMPFVVLLAVYGLYAAFKMSYQWRLQMLLVIIASVAAILVWQFGAIGYFVAIAGSFRQGLLIKFVLESILLLLVVLMIFALIEKNVLANRYKNLIKAVEKMVVGIVAIAILAVIAAFALDGRSDKEWLCTLNPGESACRRLYLPNIKQSPSLAAVLIDGDPSCRNALVSINGHQVVESPELLLRRSPSHYFLFNVMRTFAAKLGKSVDEVRQWRIVTFPASWLNMTGLNTICLLNKSNLPITIYGDYSDQWKSRRYLPIFNYFSPAMFCNTVTGTEGRILDPVGWPLIASSSWLEHKATSRLGADDLSAMGGKQTGQYRLCLMLGQGGIAKADLGKAPEVPKVLSTFNKELSSQDFDPLLSITRMPDASLRINRTIMKAAKSLTSQVILPRQLMSSPYLRIRVSGYLRASISKSCLASVVPVLVGGTRLPYMTVMASTPPYLKADSQWKHFEITDDVPPEQLIQRRNKVHCHWALSRAMGRNV